MGLVPLLAKAPSRATLESIGNQVYCQCGGCVAILNHCPHLPSECASRADMQALIKNDIRQGKSETAILQDLTLRYGVQVLASPPAKGFNWLVWILPGIGLVTGLALVLFVVGRWRVARARLPEVSTGPADPEALAAVEEEMKALGVEK